MQGTVVPSAADGGAPPAGHQEADNASSDTDFPASDPQRLLDALLTSGADNVLDVATAKALRLTCKAVRDLVDNCNLLTAVSVRIGDNDPVDAMLSSSLSTTVVAVELSSWWNGTEAVADALQTVVDHPIAGRIQKLSFDAGAVKDATGPLATRVAALPALASLGLLRSAPEGVVKRIEAGHFAALTALELDSFAAGTQDGLTQMWQALASLSRLARLQLRGGIGACFPLEAPGDMRFCGLEDLHLDVKTGYGALENSSMPCPWLETVTWPALRRFSAGPLTQGVIGSVAKSAWLSQLTALEVNLGDGRQGAPLMAALSGGTALRRLSLLELSQESMFEGIEFPRLEAIRVSLSRSSAFAAGVLADLLAASIPRLRELSLKTGSATRHLRAQPSSAAQPPFPLLRRLEVDIGNLLASSASVTPYVPAYHVIPFLLMKSVVEATFHNWDGMLTILNALWDMDGSGEGHPPPPALPQLRVLRLHGSSHASHIINSLRDKAEHCPALQEVWIDTTPESCTWGFEWWGAYAELIMRAEAAAASGCWPNLKLMTVKCGRMTDGEYKAVWWAPHPE